MQQLDESSLGGRVPNDAMIQRARAALNEWRSSFSGSDEQRERIDCAISGLDEAADDAFPSEWAAADHS
jgi:hypothetical protein